MALKHTLLGFLILHPRTGYDLYKRIEHAPFVLESTTLRRIYPTLKRLTEEGLVVFEVEPQESKPDRKVYSVTNKGEAEFLVWLREPLEQDRLDLPHFFSRFFFYGLLDKKTLLARLHDAVDARREILQELESFTFKPPLGPYGEFVDSDRVTAVWITMHGYGQALIKTQIDWFQDVIHKVENEFK